jgi:hypothetical protein
MTTQASVALYAFNRIEAPVQDDEGFAVIWRNAQRARGKLLGVWCSRLVSRLWKFSNAGWFKFERHVLRLQSVGKPRKTADHTGQP